MYVDKFLSHVEKTETCWNWTGYLMPNGYGQCKPGGTDIPVVLAHRWAYEHWWGPIPEGLEIDHLCRNRRCVNPGHLEAVTRSQNILRSPLFPLSQWRLSSHCLRGHKRSEDNTYYWRGHRQCRECNSIRNREAYVKRKVQNVD